MLRDILPTLVTWLIHSRKRLSGEQLTAKYLSRLPREEYRVINNVVIKNGKKYSQIDHIVVSIYGVFIIENRKFMGNIFGYKRAYNWTQYIGEESTSVPSPIKLNEIHEMYLRKYLSDVVSHVPVFSKVAYTGQATFKIKGKINEGVIVKNKEIDQVIKNHDLLLLDDINIFNKVYDSLLKLQEEGREFEEEYLNVNNTVKK